MKRFVYICFSLIGLGLLIVLVWRFASQRRSLPCPVWLRWLVELDNPFTQTNRANVIIQHLKLQTGMKVLDIGCGPGRLTIPVAQQVGPQGQVVALDIQAGMLRRAQEKAQAAHLSNIRFLQVGVGEGKLERNQYDRALLVTVLGEIPERKTALKEIFEALKPSGMLSVTEVIFDPHFQSRSTVRQLAGAVGFQGKPSQWQAEKCPVGSILIPTAGKWLSLKRSTACSGIGVRIHSNDNGIAAE
jgi:ubiquinone/menaquinone biosynthesis C-methylase UbiE